MHPEYNLSRQATMTPSAVAASSSGTCNDAMLAGPPSSRGGSNLQASWSGTLATVCVLALSLMTLLPSANGFSLLGGTPTCSLDFQSQVYAYVVVGTGPAVGPVLRALAPLRDDTGRPVRIAVIEQGPVLHGPGKPREQRYCDMTIPTIDVTDCTSADGETRMRNRAIPYFQVKCVGGQSCTYGALNVWPSPAAFDAWPSPFNWSAIQPHYARSERHWTCDSRDGDSLSQHEEPGHRSVADTGVQSAHGCDGPVPVALHDVAHYPPIADPVTKFCEGPESLAPSHLDYNGNTDANNARSFCGPPQISGYAYQAQAGDEVLTGGTATSTTHDNDECGNANPSSSKPCNDTTCSGACSEARRFARSTVHDAFLRHLPDNVEICSEVRVKRIIMDTGGTGASLDAASRPLHAVAVELDSSSPGAANQVLARNVIVAAGWRHTPELLMRSRIGPDLTEGKTDRSQWFTHIIPDLGRHFHDEWALCLRYDVVGDRDSVEAALQHRHTARGKQSWKNRNQLHLYKFSSNAYGHNFADVQVYLRGSSNRVSNDLFVGANQTCGFQPGDNAIGVRVALYQNDTFGTSSGVFPVGSHNVDGTVDTFDTRIELRITRELVSAADAGMQEAMKIVRLLNRTSNVTQQRDYSLRPSAPTRTIVDAWQRYHRDGDESGFVSMLADSLTLALHGGGTCGFGRCTNATNFKLFGTENVYIADMSVLPTPVDGNPHATLFALGTMLGDQLRTLSLENPPRSPRFKAPSGSHLDFSWSADVWTKCLAPIDTDNVGILSFSFKRPQPSPAYPRPEDGQVRAARLPRLDNSPVVCPYTQDEAPLDSELHVSAVTISPSGGYEHWVPQDTSDYTYEYFYNVPRCLHAGATVGFGGAWRLALETHLESKQQRVLYLHNDMWHYYQTAYDIKINDAVVSDDGTPGYSGAMFEWRPALGEKAAIDAGTGTATGTNRAGNSVRDDGGYDNLNDHHHGAPTWIHTFRGTNYAYFLGLCVLICIVALTVAKWQKRHDG